MSQLRTDRHTFIVSPAARINADAAFHFHTTHSPACIHQLVTDRASYPAEGDSGDTDDDKRDDDEGEDEEGENEDDDDDDEGRGCKAVASKSRCGEAGGHRSRHFDEASTSAVDAIRSKADRVVS
ncbi:unnamed protein product [Closterium sp. Yama58-4]|nr:unnamed protein product [Closterium sp. Yama58-4]